MVVLECNRILHHDFLLHIERKYKITNMISNVLCRSDRYCLERIMGVLNEKRCKNEIISRRYNEHLKPGAVPGVVVKVWSGR
jgi:hypothetical protein